MVPPRHTLRRDLVCGGAAMIDRKSMMVITPGRIGYLGTLGVHANRVFGAAALYVAHSRSFTICRRGVVKESMLEYVPANELHYVCSHGENIAQIVLECETVRDGWHNEWLAREDAQSFAARVHAGFAQVDGSQMGCEQFDTIFFGATLPSRGLDPRIEAVVARMRANPAARHSAEQYARDIGLSVSRFSHLFRGQTGSTLRGLSAWKRARAVLALVKTDENLVETALEAGYADSTHFCHSIRQFYGLRPRDIADIMASKDLRLVANAGDQKRLPVNYRGPVSLNGRARSVGLGVA
jgi:AraC-like DNA-binding protein